jgi:hypothetical protein
MNGVYTFGDFRRSRPKEGVKEEEEDEKRTCMMPTEPKILLSGLSQEEFPDLSNDKRLES